MSSTQPEYKNPSATAQKYRAALIVDLELTEKYMCPYCLINIPDGDYDGNCYYECDPNNKKRLLLNCAYEYRDTPPEKIAAYWAEGVLKECARVGGDELVAKWAAIFKTDGVL